MGHGAVASHVRFDKRFQGDLTATSVVHMLAVGTEVQGSAAYVAVERIVGTLSASRSASGGSAARGGSFFMQHNGTMSRGAPKLDLTVVPDSGTGALAGLSGRMTIEIVDGKHFYTFDYVLPDV